MLLRSEERLFFPDELNCKNNAITFTCDIPPESKGIESFVVVGQKLWLDQQELIQECGDAGLLENRVRKE